MWCFCPVPLPTFTSPSSTPTRCPGSTTRCSNVKLTWWWDWSKTESAWSLCCRSVSLLPPLPELPQSVILNGLFSSSHQVFNKLLSLASTASSQKYQSQMWSQMLVSTHGFLKSISNVSGKDIGPLIKQWVYPPLFLYVWISRWFSVSVSAAFLLLWNTQSILAAECVGMKGLINCTIQGDLQTKNQAPMNTPLGHLCYLSCSHYWLNWQHCLWLLGTSLSWNPSAGCVLSAAFGFLHLFLVFNSSRSETRALWWNSLAVLPSTGRGMCWSWRSVRTTHHLALRNMWWALRHSVWSEWAMCVDQTRTAEAEGWRLESSDGSKDLT